MSSPLRVWYQLLDSSTRLPYKNHSVTSIKRSSLDFVDVDEFRKAVHHENPKSLTDVDPAQLIIYKNKADFDNQHANNGKQEPLKNSCPLDGLGETEEQPLIVVIPTSSGSSETTLETGLTEYEPHPLRKKRWVELNNILDLNKNRNGSKDSTPYSSITWLEVKPVFLPETCRLPQRDIDPGILNFIVQYLSFPTQSFNNEGLGKEAQRIHFIAPILFAVCVQFQGDVQIVIEEDISGKFVKAHGRFDFMLKRKNKVVCIVEAKKKTIWIKAWPRNWLGLKWQQKLGSWTLFMESLRIICNGISSAITMIGWR